MEPFQEEIRAGKNQCARNEERRIKLHLRSVWCLVVLSGGGAMPLTNLRVTQQVWPSHGCVWRRQVNDWPSRCQSGNAICHIARGITRKNRRVRDERDQSTTGLPGVWILDVLPRPGSNTNMPTRGCLLVVLSIISAVSLCTSSQ